MTAIAPHEARRLARCAVAVEPGDPPRTTTLVLWSQDTADLRTGADVGEPGTATVALPHGDGVRTTTVPALRLGVAEALPVLLAARTSTDAHPAAVFWGTAAATALGLVARGRLLPGLTPAAHDAWRIGPLDADDTHALKTLAAAMPPSARAIPLPDTDPPVLAPAEPLVRGLADAVADTLPRTPAAPRLTGSAPFAAAEPQHVPHLRAWTDQVAAELDTGVRISLRVELPDGAEDLDDLPDDAALRAVLQVHSRTDPGLVVDAADLWRDGETGLGPRARLDTTLALRRAARLWPPLERLLDRSVPDALTLTDTELDDLLGTAAERLAGADVAVHWPRTLVRGLTATAVVGDTGAPGRAGPGLGTEPFALDWRITLDGTELTAAELDRVAQAHRPLVRLRDRWVLLSPDLARRARHRGRTPLAPVDALAAALTGTVDVDGEQVPLTATGRLEQVRALLSDPDGGDEPPRPPTALTATLRDYQLRGLRWLDRTTRLGLGCCLADDMGLGKTVTLIALHLLRAERAEQPGATLVVCPASLLGNWEKEIRRFAPATPVRRFHGSDRVLDPQPGSVTLTTYGTLRVDAERLAGTFWDLVVADEAQHAKNPVSATARALRRLPASARVALTGTPVENNLTELWAVLDWTTPGLLGPLARFRARWADAAESGTDPEAAERLARLVRPFLLRRRKSDPGIAPELPPKTETEHPVTLTPEQAGLYEALVRETMERIRASSGTARRGQVMALLTGLKQICNHPAQYLKETAPRLPGRSGKLDLLDELVTTILAEGGSALVFTQYVAMARLIERHLRDRGVPSLLLHGGTPVARREQTVHAFQEGDVPILLLSLRAAGTGLNLTRADHVVHYDRWWNPAVEEQATDRAHRIGQTRPVQVHRLVAEGTVEDRIAAVLEAKRDLAEAVLASGETALSELSDTELSELVELRRAP